MAESPCVSSFVIRIIEEPNPQYSAATYRGMIRHVQSDQEISFTSWDAVEEFILQFAPINLMVPGQVSAQFDDGPPLDREA